MEAVLTNEIIRRLREGQDELHLDLSNGLLGILYYIISYFMLYFYNLFI